MKRKLILLGILAILPVIGSASNITLQGNFTADDNLQLFSISLATPGTVDLRSYGYAGGTTSTGTVVPGGGFDTILTLFNASGTFLSENDDGAGVATDPTTGLAGDARITQNLTAGSYILALTEYDNFSQGNLADGFTESGNPNFTADPSFTTGGPCPGNLFRDISGTAGRCRTGNWTVDFTNVASVTPAAPVPEPSALLLAGLGVALLLAARWRRRNNTVAAMAGSVLALLASGPAKAQTTSPGPDYSNVNDFLNGQRSLLNVTDIQVFRQSKSRYNIGFPYNNISNNIEMLQISTNNSQQSAKTPITYNSDPDTNTTWYADSAKPMLSFSAFMFNQAGASTLTTMGDFNHTGTFALWLQNVASLNGSGNPGLWYPLAPGDNPNVVSGAVGDVTLDGYDDLALAFDDGRLLVVTPKDVNNVYANSNQAILRTAPLKALAIGDFKGDGHREIAGITINGNGGPAVVIYTVDPASLALVSATLLNLTPPSDASASNPVTHISMARGRFNSAGHDQLAVSFATNSGSSIVEVIDFAVNTLNPVEGPRLTASTVAIPQGYLEVKTGKFALPGNNYDQIVFHSSSEYNEGKFFEILSVAPGTLAITAHNAVSYGNGAIPCAYGVQVGNFDHRQPDPSNPGQTQPDLNAQVAFMYCGGPPPLNVYPANTYITFTMNIYTVDPLTLNLNGAPDSATQLGSSMWINPNADNSDAVSVAFVATDLQGRSLVLGDPTKVVVSNAEQPIAAVSSPPMHVDYVSPDGTAPPTVMNLSAVVSSIPTAAFTNTYQQQDTTSNASSTINATSWSFGAKESGSAGFSVGASNFNVKDVVTAAQTLKNDSSTANESYQDYNFKFTASTNGLSDYVSYTGSDFNIWVYPVIGKTTCPGNQSTCDNPVPLTLQFSAPNGNPVEQHVQGETLQWYQPPWEPGNVFSYPANLTQLQAIYPNLKALSDEVAFQTDNISFSGTSTWSGNQSTTVSASLNQNYSFENDLSVSASVEVPLYTADFGYKIDLSGSFGFNTLTKGTSKIGSSSGIQINKPAFTNTNYTYGIGAFIMGDKQPDSYVDNPQSLSAPPTAFGVLRAMFTADPLTSSSGKWWKQAYTKPDVALNHPNRWSITSQTSSAPNCVNNSCATLNTRSPGNPALSSFHTMRGFFISNAGSPGQNSNAGSPGQGPQLERAQAGDVLTLRARVYNYSLVDMDPDTEVHVRFYFMPWDTSNNQPVTDDTHKDGKSVLISEVTAPRIPKFDDTSTVPNWVLVPATFDTSAFDETKSGNVSIVFWVLVWMQDKNTHQKVGEMPGHGLQGTGVPETLTSFVEAANLEETVGDGKTTYSNNLALYQQPFYIEAKTLGAPAPPPRPAELNLGKIELTASRIGPGNSVGVSAMLSTTSEEADGLIADVYDGDPQADGQIVAERRIAHVDSESQYKIETSYRPDTCGTHELFVVVKGGSNQIIRRSAPVRVDCSQSMMRTPVGSTGQKLSLK